jgi:hypothetical protein
MPSTAASFHSLPFDLLPVIFRFFPINPRLYTLSRVCRRWRAAALRSITTIAHDLGVLSESIPRINALLPNVTSLFLDRGFLEVDLSAWRSLARLTLVSNAPRVLIPSTVTSLALQHISSAYLPAHLAPVQDTLRKATLSPDQLTSLKELLLPSLTSLRLNFAMSPRDNDAVLALVARHASRLRSLELGAYEKEEEVAEQLGDMSFPQLCVV